MSDRVSYQGKTIGRIKMGDVQPNKLVFIAEDLDSLGALFQLKNSDGVDVEGHTMHYEDFRRDVLSKITAFYPTDTEWLLKNYRARTIQEAEKELRVSRG